MIKFVYFYVSITQRKIYQVKEYSSMSSLATYTQNDKHLSYSPAFKCTFNYLLSRITLKVIY